MNQEFLKEGELYLLKAQTAELHHQVENYKKHYQKFEDIVQDLILESEKNQNQNTKKLESLLTEVILSNQTLGEHTENVVMGVADRLNQSCDKIFENHCNQYFAALNYENQNMKSTVNKLEAAYAKYEQKIEKEYHKLCQIQKLKYIGILISSILSPIAILLYFLELMGLIHLLK